MNEKENTVENLSYDQIDLNKLYFISSYSISDKFSEIFCTILKLTERLYIRCVSHQNIPLYTEKL